MIPYSQYVGFFNFHLITVYFYAIILGFAEFGSFLASFCDDAACPEPSPKSARTHRTICKFNQSTRLML